MKAILTIGIPASGKTTWAEEFVRKNGNWMNINRDDIRFSVYGLSSRADYKFSREKEEVVTTIQQGMIISAAEHGKNVVISDTNLVHKYRVKAIRFLEQNGYEVGFKEFPISFEEALRRDVARANGVGHTVLWDHYKKWLVHKGQEEYVPNKELPAAIIVDIDGTVADMDGIREPYEWDKVDQDRLVRGVADIVVGLSLIGYKVIFVSGRDGICYDGTMLWLSRHFGTQFELYMRKAGDSRKDSIIKEEIFWRDIAPNYNVRMVIDDRMQVVRMWNSMGLKTICVADPFVEF